MEASLEINLISELIDEYFYFLNLSPLLSCQAARLFINAVPNKKNVGPFHRAKPKRMHLSRRPHLNVPCISLGSPAKRYRT